MSKDEALQAADTWFGLDNDALQPGDIVLTTSPHKMSATIRFLTLGSFSHAMLFVGDHSVLEAPGENQRVRSRNIQRIFFRSRAHCKVLRGYDFDQIDGMNVVMSVRTKVGTIYSVPEAKKVLRRPNYSAEEWNTQFCSRLVAQAYHESGIEIVRNPDYCSPADIDRSNSLFEVRNALREVQQEEYEEFSKPSPSLELSESSMDEIFNEVKVLCGASIQTIEQLTQVLELAPLYDEQVTRIIHNSGYLNCWRLEKEENPELYDYSIFNAKFPDKDWQNWWGASRLNAIGGVNHQAISLASFRSKQLQQPLQYFALMIALYENLADIENERLAVYQQAYVAT